MLRPIFLLCSLLPSLSIAADVLDQLGPDRTPDAEPQRRPTAEAESSAQGAVSDEETLIEKLHGIIIGTEQEVLKAASTEGVSILAKTAPASVNALAQAALGKPMSLTDLKKLEASLETALQKAGNPLQDVFLPPQEVTDGIVRFAIRDRKVGKVKLKGQLRFGKKMIAKEFTTRENTQPNQRKITEDLQWLNQNPFRRVDLAYVDGATPDVADIVLQVSEQRPYRFFTGVNNGSSERLGDERWLAGFQLGNLWGLEHSLTGQYLSSFESNALQAFAGSYRMPIIGRSILEISGLTSDSDVQLPNELDLSGNIWQLGVKLEKSLPAWGDVRHHISLGTEWQENSYLLTAADGRKLERGTSIFNLTLRYELHWADALGYTTLDAELVHSPGWWQADAAEYAALRAGAETTYSLARLKLDRTWWLPWDATLITRLAGQYTNEPLLSSERYTVTGQSEVRGYDESAAFADRAFRATVELRTKAVKTPLGKVFKQTDRLTGVAFWDYASLSNAIGKTPGPLQGVGVGIRYQWGKNISLKADVAWPLEDITPTIPEDQPRWHLGMTLSF